MKAIKFIQCTLLTAILCPLAAMANAPLWTDRVDGGGGAGRMIKLNDVVRLQSGTNIRITDAKTSDDDKEKKKKEKYRKRECGTAPIC